MRLDGIRHVLINGSGDVYKRQMLDDIAIGKATAKALFESIGGEGQVCLLYTSRCV